MSMTISRKLVGVNRLKDKPLMPQEFQVPASRGYQKEKGDSSGAVFSTPTKRYRLSSFFKTTGVL